MKEICQLYCYVQIIPGGEMNFFSSGGMAGVYRPISDSKFKIVQIEKSDDIWAEFKRIFGGRADV